MREYSFVTRWFFEAPLDRVFAVIDDAGAWPSWWRSVASVQVVESGAGDGIGRVARTTWRTALGYGLTFDARVTRREPPRLIEVEAMGDLAGRGRWSLAPEREGTAVVYEWNVVTHKAWMNWLAPVLRPAFAWNHDNVMRRGGEGLGRRLSARFEDRTAP
jgi:hypothetical protein